MRFLCLVNLDKEEAAALSEPDWREIDRNSLDYDDVLARQGHYITSAALQPVDTAVTVRVRKGETMMTDGPFMETKEHVAGFILIEAKDMAEALEVARQIPLARIGSIEVRPIMTLERP